MLSANDTKHISSSSTFNLAKSQGRTCSFCNRLGHVAEQCWDKLAPVSPAPRKMDTKSTAFKSLVAKAQLGPAKSAICTFCGRRGHIAPKCWNKHPTQKPAHVVLVSATQPLPDPNTVGFESVIVTAKPVRPIDITCAKAPFVAYVGTTVACKLSNGPAEIRHSGLAQHISQTVGPRVTQSQHGSRRKQSRSMHNQRICYVARV